MDAERLFIRPRVVTGALSLKHETLNQWIARGVVRNLDAQKQGVVGNSRFYSVGDFRALALCTQAMRLGILDRFLGSYARDAVREYEKGARLLFVSYTPEDDGKTKATIRFDEPPADFVAYLAVSMSRIIADADDNLRLIGLAVAIRRQHGFEDEDI